MKIAVEADWKALPMPDLHTAVPLGLLYNAKQMYRMKWGVIPREMEDKWFVYWKGADLYFHRSWTGFCLYIVHFEVEDIGAKAVEATLNRDPDQYGNTDDIYDGQMIVYLISVLLLRRPAKFPSKSTDRRRRVLEQWSQVGRAGLGEHPDDEVN